MIKSPSVHNLIYGLGAIAILIFLAWGQGHAIGWAERFFERRKKPH